MAPGQCLYQRAGLKLARSLVERTFADKVYLCNSGGEANEAALKLARRWAYDHHGERKNRIVSFGKSFHGRTFFTVSVGGQPKYSQASARSPAASCMATSMTSTACAT